MSANTTIADTAKQHATRCGPTSDTQRAGQVNTGDIVTLSLEEVTPSIGKAWAFIEYIDGLSPTDTVTDIPAFEIPPVTDTEIGRIVAGTKSTEDTPSGMGLGLAVEKNRYLIIELDCQGLSSAKLVVGIESGNTDNDPDEGTPDWKQENEVLCGEATDRKTVIQTQDSDTVLFTFIVPDVVTHAYARLMYADL
ncbi:hypothetical protein ACFSYH_09105 [Populibacterium corticicola]|uniref:Uncharacterized protein n=1 Tax=Populibacterium corticicola TaxID=1812826 RepID=A0ABW5XG54_9MICO